ncbi:MAG: FxsA family protein [Chromatiaceae bacterium]|nr:FxsA family protein [Chromatiaceae bacterium]MCP5315357.1 FxsA family protein [Chromatiaceae bacterium]
MSSPGLIFLFIFVAAPLIELYLLIEVGSEIGALPTILLSIFTAVLGGALVRMQGLAVLFRAQAQMANREVPAFELLEGVLLVLAGLMLLLPGFVTDTLGFLLLLPSLRRWLILRWLAARVDLQPAPGENRRSPVHPDRVIEGDYKRED